MSAARTHHAITDLRDGAVASRGESSSEEAADQLSRFAPVAAEIFAADRAAWAYAAFERALVSGTPDELCELVLVGDEHVHVVQRLPGSERALLSVGRWDRLVGAVVSDARDELARRVDDGEEGDR